MTGEILFVFGLLLITIILFVSGLFRLDVVAIMVIITLILSGLLSPTAALAGFGDPVVLLIAGLFVVGEALFRTGVAYAIGDWLMSVAGTNGTSSVDPVDAGGGWSFRIYELHWGCCHIYPGSS